MGLKGKKPDRKGGQEDATQVYHWDLEQEAYNNRNSYGDDAGNDYDDGYYQDDNYADGYYDDGYYDDGYYDNGYYPQEDYNDYGDYYEPPQNRGPSMAARAAGKANTEPYGRPRNRNQTRNSNTRPSANQRDYGEDYPRPRKRRKKRHPLRNFCIFLLIFGAALVGIYHMLFQAPEQWTDGYHTRKDGIYNILICATDEDGTRTDTIMIATLNEDTGALSLTSLPRDTIVDNGEYVPKLNGVYGIAGAGTVGAEAMLDAVQTLLGFRPDGYAIIDYQIFKDAVDAMGGVTFDVPMDMVVSDNHGNYLEIPAGEQLLDGETALGVCRFRYGYLMADIQRQYVQQTFLKAMLQQLISVDKITKLPAVYQAAMGNVITNLSDANIRYLGLEVLLAGLGDIQQNTLPGEGVDYNGASCYGLYGQSTVDMVNQVMNPFEEEITIEDVHILTVYGGTLVESTWRGTAFDASQYEYN